MVNKQEFTFSIFMQLSKLQNSLLFHVMITHVEIEIIKGLSVKMFLMKSGASVNIVWHLWLLTVNIDGLKSLIFAGGENDISSSHMENFCLWN